MKHLLGQEEGEEEDAVAPAQIPRKEKPDGPPLYLKTGKYS